MASIPVSQASPSQPSKPFFHSSRHHSEYQVVRRGRIPCPVVNSFGTIPGHIGPLCNLCVSIQSDTWFFGTDNLATTQRCFPFNVSTTASILLLSFHSSFGPSVIPTQVSAGCIPRPRFSAMIHAEVSNALASCPSKSTTLGVEIYPPKRYRRYQSRQIGASEENQTIGPTSQSCCICYMCNDVVFSLAIYRYWHDFAGIIEGIQR